MANIAAFPWLPVGHEIAAGVGVGRVVGAGTDYQLIRAREGDDVIMLAIASAPLGAKLAGLHGNDAVGIFDEIRFGPDRYLAAAFGEDAGPVVVGERPSRPVALLPTEATALADALADLAAREPDAAWESALFFPSLNRCVATAGCDTEDKRALAVRLVTGGIADSALSAKQMAAINVWMSVEEIERFLARLGVQTRGAERPVAWPSSDFRLPGRPKLEALFREYVIDYYRNRERYRAMKVDPSGGFLLHGPPGSGKTHAAQALATYLGWPVFEIDVSKVGSPFIHQTSVQLRRAFSDAAAKAPAIVILNEFDALAGSRAPSSHDHKIEEVAELLRLMERASADGIVVVATTNRRGAIDDAMLRRGRFDHIVEVGYPTVGEVESALAHMLAPRPHAAALNIEKAAEKLKNRPMSDIAWTVNEAARLAVKTNKNEIDDICLFQAIAKLA